MASKKDTTEVAKVRCCDCKLFKRDKEGRCFNIETGVYFMGTCPKMHKDGVTVIDKTGKPIGGKVFSDKLRVCTDYKPR